MSRQFRSRSAGRAATSLCWAATTLGGLIGCDFNSVSLNAGDNDVDTAPAPRSEPGDDLPVATDLTPVAPRATLPSARPLTLIDPTCDENVDSQAAPSRVFDTPLGWAASDDLGLQGTTGGQGGAVVLARTRTELADFAGTPGPLIIRVCGLIAADPSGPASSRIVSVTSDKTIVGVGTRPTLALGLDLFEVSNVVVMNLFIQGAIPDGIATRRSHHLWIDHVDISDSSDGNLDITNGSDYVTVSYSRFWYRDSDQPHRFSNLIGSSDNAPADVGKLRVTLHHNWWADNVFSRMPRVRYGDVHVFNNYYTTFGGSACIFAGTEAEVRVEANYFQQAGLAIELGGGTAFEQGNVFDSTAQPLATAASAFEPPYSYTLDEPASLPAALVTQTGPQRL